MKTLLSLFIVVLFFSMVNAQNTSIDEYISQLPQNDWYELILETPIESNHPYRNDDQKYFSLPLPENTLKVQVFFEKVELEEKQDFLILKGKSVEKIEASTQEYTLLDHRTRQMVKEEFWSPEVEIDNDELNIFFEYDRYRSFYGFRINKYKYYAKNKIIGLLEKEKDKKLSSMSELIKSCETYYSNLEKQQSQLKQSINDMNDAKDNLISEFENFEKKNLEQQKKFTNTEKELKEKKNSLKDREKEIEKKEQNIEAQMEKIGNVYEELQGQIKNLKNDLSLDDLQQNLNNNFNTIREEFGEKNLGEVYEGYQNWQEIHSYLKENDPQKIRKGYQNWQEIHSYLEENDPQEIRKGYQNWQEIHSYLKENDPQEIRRKLENLIDLEKEFENLKTKNIQLEKENNNYKKKEHEFDEKEKNLKEFEKNILSRDTKLLKLIKKKIDHAESESNNWLKDLQSKLTSSLTSTNITLEERKQQIKNLESEIARLGDELKSISKFEMLEKEYKFLEEQNKLLKEEYEEQKKINQIIESNKEKQILYDYYQLTKQQQQELNQNAKSQFETINKLLEETIRWRDDKQNFAYQNELLKKENDITKQKVQNLKETVLHLNEQILMKHQELKSLEEKIVYLKDNLGQNFVDAANSALEGIKKNTQNDHDKYIQESRNIKNLIVSLQQEIVSLKEEAQLRDIQKVTFERDELLRSIKNFQIYLDLLKKYERQNGTLHFKEDKEYMLVFCKKFINMLENY